VRIRTCCMQCHTQYGERKKAIMPRVTYFPALSDKKINASFSFYFSQSHFSCLFVSVSFCICFEGPFSLYVVIYVYGDTYFRYVFVFFAFLFRFFVPSASCPSSFITLISPFSCLLLQGLFFLRSQINWHTVASFSDKKFIDAFRNTSDLTSKL
jgi:hypothetical protein